MGKIHFKNKKLEGKKLIEFSCGYRQNPALNCGTCLAPNFNSLK